MQLIFCTLLSYGVRRGVTTAAFTHGDVVALMFGGYLCCGDCIEGVNKPF